MGLAIEDVLIIEDDVSQGGEFEIVRDFTYLSSKLPWLDAILQKLRVVRP